MSRDANKRQRTVQTARASSSVGVGVSGSQLQGDVLNEIFGFIDVEDVLRAASVCRDWRDGLRYLGDKIWSPLTRKHHPDLERTTRQLAGMVPGSAISLRSQFKRRHTFLCNKKESTKDIAKPAYVAQVELTCYLEGKQIGVLSTIVIDYTLEANKSGVILVLAFSRSDLARLRFDELAVAVYLIQREDPTKQTLVYNGYSGADADQSVCFESFSSFNSNPGLSSLTTGLSSRLSVLTRCCVGACCEVCHEDGSFNHLHPCNCSPRRLEEARWRSSSCEPTSSFVGPGAQNFHDYSFRLQFERPCPELNRKFESKTTMGFDLDEVLEFGLSYEEEPTVANKPSYVAQVEFACYSYGSRVGFFSTIVQDVEFLSRVYAATVHFDLDLDSDLAQVKLDDVHVSVHLIQKDTGKCTVIYSGATKCSDADRFGSRINFEPFGDFHANSGLPSLTNNLSSHLSLVKEGCLCSPLCRPCCSLCRRGSFFDRSKECYHVPNRTEEECDCCECEPKWSCFHRYKFWIQFEGSNPKLNLHEVLDWGLSYA